MGKVEDVRCWELSQSGVLCVVGVQGWLHFELIAFVRDQKC